MLATASVLSVEVQAANGPVTDERAEAGASTRLEVLTYNIHGLPRWLGGPRPGQFERIAAAIESEEAHLVLLQEAWTSAARKAVPRNGDWSVATGLRAGNLFQQSGLITASRLPMIGGEFRRFGRASLPDSLVEKGALKVTLELPDGQRVNVWNVHLQAGRAAEVRAHQVAELIRWVRAADDGQVMDLVGGDFNCTPDSAEYQHMIAHLGTDVRHLARQPHVPTFPEPGASAKSGRTLDYVFCSPRERARVTSAQSEIVFDARRAADRLSDHLGVRVSLAVQIPPPVEPALAFAFVGTEPRPLTLRRQLAPWHPFE
jgi:endonuclease/exonuclease/phosphatase family metal-dependent hydrolase